jgi:hypothetical protein
MTTPTNQLLAFLSAKDRRLLEPNLVATKLTLRMSLERPHKPIETVAALLRPNSMEVDHVG